MKFLALIILIPTLAFGQAPRRVSVDCRALFAFDPLTDRYVAGSLSQVAEYVTQWRTTDSIDLTFSLNLLPGYLIYEKLVDSTLSSRVFNYFAPFRIDTAETTIKFAQMPHSKEFNEHFDGDIQKIRQFFATPIASLGDTLHIRNSYYGASKFASLLHRFQLEECQADVSLFAPPAPDGFLGPNIYIKDIYKQFRFDNTLTVSTMTGREIKNYLETAYRRRYFTLRDENSDLVRLRTPYFLHISAAGLSYRVNLTKGTIEDFSLELNKSYRVAANSFIAKDFTIVSTIGDYRLLLVKWLQQGGAKECEVVEKWTLSPERWVKVIVEREKRN